jgi:hypothetical protein
LFGITPTPAGSGRSIVAMVWNVFELRTWSALFSVSTA